MTMTETLILAILSATDARKAAALRVLRGEAEIGTSKAESKEPEPFITLKECAKRLGVSACSLWRWGVPGHELGGRRKFRMEEVDAYLQSEKFRVRANELREADSSRRQANQRC